MLYFFPEVTVQPLKHGQDSSSGAVAGEAVAPVIWAMENGLFIYR